MGVSPITKDFMAEHAHILKKVQAIQAEVKKVHSRFSLRGGNDLQKHLQQLRYDLLRHFQREETELFQNARYRTSNQYDLRLLESFLTSESENDLQGHRFMIDLIDKMLDSLREEKDSSENVSTLADHLATILSRHASAEETVIFPLIVQNLHAHEPAHV